MNPISSEFFKYYRLQISIFSILIGLVIIYMIGSPLAFTSFPMYRAFMSTMPFFGIIAISATLVITLGEIDLSFPSVVGITSLIFGLVLVETESFFIAFILSVSVGMFAGLINGLLVTKVGIPSIVATIGTMFFWRGLVNVIAKGKGIAITLVEGSLHHKIFVGRLFGYIPAQFIWFIITAIVIGVIYRNPYFWQSCPFRGRQSGKCKDDGD